MMHAMKLAVALAATLATGNLLADGLTVVSFGGANKEAQVKAFYTPWQQASGHRLVSGEYNGELARIKAMVETRSVAWDVVEVESSELARGCEDGLFEPIDPARLGLSEDDFVPGSLHPCGVGFLVYSTVLAYNSRKLNGAPSGWSDFWDIERFPGKRGLRKLAKSTLEFALLADGVEAGDLYRVLATPEGQNRAFAKLDQIKPHIQWWEAGAQAPQYLAAGDVVMSSIYNGRLSAAQRQQYGLAVVWSGGLYEFDAWAIPKGAKQQALTRDFIAYTLKPEQQKRFAETIDYGAVNLKAMDLLQTARIAELPTAPQNLALQVPVDVAFWIDHGEQLEQRFNAWAAR